MITTHECFRGTPSTPDAYDGFWLELLENPDAALPRREAGIGSEGTAADFGYRFSVGGAIGWL